MNPDSDNHLGSSTFLTDAAGEPYQFVMYLPFGETFAEQRAAGFGSPYLFNAKELDEETGLYYYGARYYDPRVSIFINVDPLAERYPSYSPYTYTLNNPVRYIDPDGKRVEDIIVEGVKYEVGASGEGKSEFVQQTFAALNQIVNGDDKQASGLVNYLATTDDYEVEISNGTNTHIYVSTGVIDGKEFVRKPQSMVFNPTQGIADEKTGEAFSPDVSMVHELGHLKNAIDDIGAWKNRVNTTDLRWGDLEEKETIMKFEVPYSRSRNMLERTAYSMGYKPITTINSTNAITPDQLNTIIRSIFLGRTGGF